MDTTPVIVERHFNASTTEMWEALTDNQKLQQWYFKLPDFRAEPGFEFTFTGGDEDDQYLHFCKVIEAVPVQKLSYTWRYEDVEGITLVTIELFPVSDGTLLRLTHQGLEQLAAGGPKFAKSNFVQGWNYFINDALKNFIESTV